MSGRAPSPQHYHHNNNPSSSSANRSQQRPPPVATTGGAVPASSASITCSRCGCLNFSTEWSTCEPCQQKETATTTASSSTGAAAIGTSGKSLPATAALLVSSRTAILKKQTPAPPSPPPRTGIATGLHHGLPIDAYRNGGRRNSLLGAKINRDGESPAASQSSSGSSNSAQTLGRSNSPLDLDQRTSGGASSASNSSSSQQQAEKPSQGTELYYRVLAQQQRSLEAKRKAGSNSNYKSTSEADETDEKNSIARFVDASGSNNSSNATSGDASLVAASPAASSRPNKRSRSGGNGREVIDLISSSDEGDNDDDDDDVKSVDSGRKQNAVPTTSATQTNSDKPSDQEARVQAPTTTSTTATAKPSARTEPGPPAVPVASVAAAWQPPVEVAAARISTAATGAAPSPAVAARPPDNTAQESDMSDEDVARETLFRSRRFPVVAFDSIDFPPTDAAAVLKLRARRNSVGLEGSGGATAAAATAGLSQQQTAAVAPEPVRSAVAVAVPSAVAPPLRTPEVREEKEKEKVTPKPTPTPTPAAQAAPVVQKPTPPAPVTAPVVQKVREEPAKPQAQVPTVTSNADVVLVEAPQQQTDASAPSASTSVSASGSVRLLKRTASGVCQEQAIDLGDDDESSQEQVFSIRGELFRSRVFQSVDFNASDFSTVHDGLHIARRSKIAAQSAVQQESQPQEQQQQQQQRAAGAAPSQERSTNATTARCDVVPPPSTSQAVQAVPTTPSRPATIPPDSVRATTTTTTSTSTSASALETRQVSAAQLVVPPRQVNVVPMSPRESSVQRAQPNPPAPRTELKAPVSSVERNAPVPSSAARPVPPPQGPTPVSEPTVTPPAATSKPTTTSVPVTASTPTEPAPLNAPTAFPTTSTNRSSEAAARPATTASTVSERIPPPPTTTTTMTAPSSVTATTILLARKKLPQATPAPVPSSGASVSATKDVKANTAATAVLPLSSHPKKEEVVKAREVVPVVKRIAKPPALGDCSVDFMGFMKDFIDGDDEAMNDEEETRKLHLQLLEVVDLTNLTDSDGDDSSDDGDDISEPLTPTAAAAGAGVNPAKPALLLTSGFGTQSMHHPTPAFGAVSALGPTGFFASDPSRTAPRITFTAAAGGVVTAGSIAGLPKPDRRRAVRQLEPCVICEEKKWVKTMIHCKDCGKYYHKKCAKDYGDEKICWNCELDGMIDDSELTETARDTVVDMLSTLRHASSSSEGEEEDDADDEVAENANGGANSSHNTGEGEESKKETDDGDDDDDEEEESKRDSVASTTARKPPMLPGSSTKSMQRWKTFLDVSTSTVDKTFHEVTKAIDAELQSDEQKAKYSKGFTTPEIFQAQISEVLDSYADLQDQLDREAREKPREPSASTGAGGAADAQETSAVTAESRTESVGVNPVVRESSSASTRVILDLSGSSDSPVQSVQLNREVVISDGV